MGRSSGGLSLKDLFNAEDRSKLPRIVGGVLWWNTWWTAENDSVVAFLSRIGTVHARSIETGKRVPLSLRIVEDSAQSVNLEEFVSILAVYQRTWNATIHDALLKASNSSKYTQEQRFAVHAVLASHGRQESRDFIGETLRRPSIDKLQSLGPVLNTLPHTMLEPLKSLLIDALTHESAQVYKLSMNLLAKLSKGGGDVLDKVIANSAASPAVRARAMYATAKTPPQYHDAYAATIIGAISGTNAQSLSFDAARALCKLSGDTASKGRLQLLGKYGRWTLDLLLHYVEQPSAAASENLIRLFDSPVSTSRFLMKRLYRALRACTRESMGDDIDTWKSWWASKKRNEKPSSK